MIEPAEIAAAVFDVRDRARRPARPTRARPAASPSAYEFRDVPGPLRGEQRDFRSLNRLARSRQHVERAGGPRGLPNTAATKSVAPASASRWISLATRRPRRRRWRRRPARPRPPCRAWPGTTAAGRRSRRSFAACSRAASASLVTHTGRPTHDARRRPPGLLGRRGDRRARCGRPPSPGPVIHVTVPSATRAGQLQHPRRERGEQQLRAAARRRCRAGPCRATSASRPRP